MTEVRFNNNNEYFQNLVREARKLASDGKLDNNDIARLKDIVKSDGTVTLDEKLFIKALSPDTNKINTEKLKASDINPYDFGLDVDPLAPPLYFGYQKDKSLKNPMDAQIKDIGTDKFNSVMDDKNITAVTLKQEILESLTIKNNPALQSKIENLASRLPDNKEAMMYLKELITARTPPVSVETLEKILDKLDAMLSTDYDNRIGNRKNFVVSSIHDIAAPANISQNNIGTCGGTCIQIQLATRNPAEYLNMLDSLAQNKNYTAVTGREIIPNRTFAYENMAESKDSKRTITSKIMQNSIMNYASWERRSVNMMEIFNPKIEFNSAKGEGGLYVSEQKAALEALTGIKVDIFNNIDYTPDQLVKIMRSSNPSQENPVTISMSFDSGGRDSFHVLNLIGLDDKKATIINPWGRIETFSTDKLKERTYAVLGKPGAARDIPRINSEAINSIDQKESHWYESTNGVSKIINDPSKRNDFFNKLTGAQKADLIASLKSGTVSNEDQTAIMRVIENALQGKDGPNSQVIPELYKNLEKHGIQFYNLLKDLKTDNDLYFNIATKVFNAGSDKTKAFIAPAILDGSQRSYKFLNSLSDTERAKLAKSLNGDKMADHPYIAARLLSGMIKTYNEQGEKSPVTLKDISKFVAEIDKDWTGDDDTMKFVLKELGYDKDSSKIDPKSAYATFHKDKEAAKILGEIIFIAD